MDEVVRKNRRAVCLAAGSLIARGNWWREQVITTLDRSGSSLGMAASFIDYENKMRTYRARCQERPTALVAAGAWRFNAVRPETEPSLQSLD
jgi:hypothetical protein